LRQENVIVLTLLESYKYVIAYKTEKYDRVEQQGLVSILHWHDC